MFVFHMFSSQLAKSSSPKNDAKEMVSMTHRNSNVKQTRFEGGRFFAGIVIQFQQISETNPSYASNFPCRYLSKFLWLNTPRASSCSPSFIVRPHKKPWYCKSNHQSKRFRSDGVGLKPWHLMQPGDVSKGLTPSSRGLFLTFSLM